MSALISLEKLSGEKFRKDFNIKSFRREVFVKISIEKLSIKRFLIDISIGKLVNRKFSARISIGKVRAKGICKAFNRKAVCMLPLVLLGLLVVAIVLAVLLAMVLALFCC